MREPGHDGSENRASAVAAKRRIVRTGPLWALTVTSVLFPLFALIGLLLARRAIEVNRAVRWPVLFASAVFLIVSAYLAWFGVIGWRSWT